MARTSSLTPSLCNDRVDVIRKITTTDANMSPSVVERVVHACLRCSVQPVSSREKVFMSKDTYFITHRVYMPNVVDIQVGDVFVWGAIRLEIIGVPHIDTSDGRSCLVVETEQKQ